MKEERRPWGNFKQFVLNQKCTVKIIEVKPFQKLSLQVHKKRDENWYFLTCGKVQIGNIKRRVKKGELVVIKKNVPHRACAGWKKVRFLEVSFGTFNEKDEVRLEDKYNRK